MADKSSWQIDPSHSSVEFSIKHMMLTTVRGRFKDFRGTVTGDETNPSQAQIEVEIDTASVDTGASDRDQHLRSPEFFDAEGHPHITFHSKRIEGTPKQEGDHFRVIGDLTICDTTEEVTLDVEFEGRGQDPWGNERAGFSAKTEIDRRDWGLKWNQTLETGGILVANRVRIETDVQIVKQTQNQQAAA